jgi:hypothetical protein
MQKFRPDPYFVGVAIPPAPSASVVGSASSKVSEILTFSRNPYFAVIQRVAFIRASATESDVDFSYTSQDSPNTTIKVILEISNHNTLTVNDITKE